MTTRPEPLLALDLDLDDGLDDDDRPIGRVLSRREVLAVFGFTSVAAFIAACAPAAVGTATPAAPTAAPAAPTATPVGATGTPAATGAATAATPAAGATTAPAATSAPVATTAAIPSCIVRPELTEGPYFVDEKLERSDIRPDPATGTVSEGVPLKITFAVAKLDGTACVPFEGALVDVWHCDALGVYSDVQGSSGTKFLRGYQVTDANGLAEFLTIYPGWYRGRAVHIHFKIRDDAAASSGLEFTSQFFFDDTVSDQVFTLAPYSQKGSRDQRNENDGIFGQSGGQLTLALTGDPNAGFETVFDIGVQTS